ncbi:MAG: HAD hydrolase family protein [Candidatus Gastranaerophilales bacterium]|nr:HAD hydrolase family protein [Candidatus Gastranaerophilales bacterium]
MPMINDLTLKLKAKNIKFVAFDVDGVMTDGSLIYLPSGEQVKSFNAKDGQGVVMLNKAGFLTGIITAKESAVVLERAKTLGITKLFTGQKNKLNALEAIIEEFKIEKSQVAYMGDDYPDLCIIKEAGLSCCPNDAIQDVKKAVSFVSSYGGGKGAVREFCDFILKANGISWKSLTAK